MKNEIWGIDGFYRIVPLKLFRETEGVRFETVPAALMPDISSLDIVSHVKGAVSPGPVEGSDRPWYMHPSQGDNLIVLEGDRTTELYRKGFGSPVTVKLGRDFVEVDGRTVSETPSMLVWEPEVFHRVVSGPGGSLSINLAVHKEGFDIKSNFNIYDLDTETGNFELLRKGEMDQQQ